MGAAQFKVFTPEPDSKKAFQSAVEDARWESGHGGYTGTIGEKDSFVVRSKKAMSQLEADHFAATDIEDTDKWGPAFAVPVAEEKGSKIMGWLFYGLASS